MMRSVWGNWLVALLGILTTYILLPFNIHGLGDDAYGAWLLITSFTGYLAMLSLGAPMATVRYAAQYIAEGDAENLDKVLGTIAGLYVTMGLIALLIGVGLFYAFGAVYDLPAGLESQSHVAFVIVILCIGVGFIQQLPYGIMAAYQDFGVRNLVMVGAMLLRLGLNLFLVWKWPSVTSLAILNLSVLLFEVGVCWVVLRRRYPKLRIHLELFDVAMLRNVLSYSLFVSVLSIGVLLSYQTDSLVIGGFLDIGVIPQYSVANSVTLYLMEFIASIALVVMPMATTLHSTGDTASLQRLFLKWSKLALSLSLLTGSFLIVLGPRFLEWWMGPEFEGPAGSVLRILMISFLVFLPARGVAQPVLMGIGKPRGPSVAFAVAGVLNLALSLVWVRAYGLGGVAWGTAVPNILLGMTMVFMTCRALSMPVVAFAQHVVWRPAIGSVPGFLFLWWAHDTLDVHGLVELMASGLVLVAVFAVMWVGFVYRNDADVDFVAWIRTRLSSRDSRAA